ncbi:acyl-CoA N-acyltransferase [Protomyces lactucae-debilis]|uniref:Histone acetyltransferase type B catalytic subunit n=1 Tax=Protomyces lactucae-debilis TaxID=2754530 RepID=A0A1Y2FLU2_PROLT|nr:acyl-CoA N-acyltransferase [Protomyces lactucae-debilis]ORY84961.1 acyl-CoA N-acyltransferase [Protomyces lactucae-debilis]
MVERPEDWTTDSTAALSLHLFDGPGHDQETILQPKWTYALFGETEQIFGYKKLRIRLYIHALTLQTWLDVRYEEQLAVSLGVHMEPVEEILLNHLPHQTKVCINGKVVSSDASQLKTVDVAAWKKAVVSESRSGTQYKKPIHFYTRAGKTFAILKLALPDSQDCVSWMQIFSLLYIEGASLIDEEDERFDVFVVYETQDGQPIRFVGYCTCYKYYFYDKATHAFDVVRYRISQFLTLPHFQKQGHGGQLYDTIFADCQRDSKVLEVTVEDPSEAFDDLRDRRDFSRLLRERTLETLAGQGLIPSPAAISDASRKAKMAPAQFRRMLELYLLRQANAPNKGKQPASSSFGRQLRLFIKRRIYKKNAAVLKLLDPSERKRKLAETYTAQVEDYRRILKTLKVESREAGNGISDALNGSAEPASKRVRVE